LALASSLACTHPVEGPLAGASDAPTKPAEIERPPAPAAPTWDAYADVQSWPAVNAVPFTARGHQPEQQVDVRVSPESRVTYSTLVVDSVFSDGCVLAELSHSGDGRGYGMRKAGGSWSFFELDARGGVLASGPLRLCAGCHAQAPADCVFGLPRGATGAN
jgi:hypothetical protein